MTAPLELTILMPCLDEARTVARCVAKARGFLARTGIAGEVLVADNGSQDGSQQLAREAGARVVDVAERGYGAALLGGMQAAQGRFVIMGDADDSYDFEHLEPFVAALRGGAQLVMGNRFKGGIAPGAMPALHRYLGNPVLSGLGHLFFPSTVGDFHCGLRGFDRDAMLALTLQSPGMEFASEMVVKATVQGLRVQEVPTTLQPDGRGRPPHLRSWRDGWRHLRLLLVFSPRWLFLYPGLALLALGLVAMLWLAPAPRSLGGVTLSIHTLLFAGVAIELGVLATSFAVFAKVHAAQAGWLPIGPRLAWFMQRATLERGLIAGLLLVVAGAVGSVHAVWQWSSAGMGPLVPEQSMRLVIPSATALLVGSQLALAAFMLEVLQWGKRAAPEVSGGKAALRVQSVRSQPRRATVALTMLAVTALMLWLVEPIPMRYISWAHYDETLFLRLAQYLVRGEWLGPYDRVTLVKGVGFPLWLAAVHVLKLPVLLAATLTQALAAAVAYRALRPLLPSRTARLVVFAALALCPTGLSEFNLMRELIFPALTLLAVAATVGWLLRLGSPRAWPWAAAAGLSAALFALTREDAWAALPLMAAVLVVVGLHVRRRARATRVAPVVAQLGLVGTLLIAPMLAVATLNWHHYGVFKLLEMNSRPFTSAYGALARVRHAATAPQVPVPRETWVRAAAVSPAFAETARHLLGEVGTGSVGPGVSNVGPLFEVNDAIREWLSKEMNYVIPKPAPGTGKRWFIETYANDARFKRNFDRYLGGPGMSRAFLSDAMDHEIAAMRFVWILRESVVAAGHHRSAPEAARYYQRVADEVNAACASGKLDCRSKRHSLAPPFSREHRRLMPWALGVAATALLTLETHTTVARVGHLGTEQELKAASDFTHQRITTPSAAVPLVPGYEALIRLWRAVLPACTLAALAVWLWCAPRVLRAGVRELADSVNALQRALWWLATLLLALVLMRLGLMAVVHVSSWPAATTVRYLSSAHPLLVVFIGCAGALGWQRWANRR